MQLNGRAFFRPPGNVFRPAANRDRPGTNRDCPVTNRDRSAADRDRPATNRDHQKIIKVPLFATLKPTAARDLEPRSMQCPRRTFPKKS